MFAWTFLNVGFDAPAASTTVAGIVELATNAETATGTDATIAVTPAGLSSAYIAKSALTAKGDIISATAAATPSALGVGADGCILTACAAATTGLCWASAPVTGIPCGCITAKGSLISGTAAATPTALPVGTDGDVLVACSTASTGLCWTAPTPSGIPCACIVGKGGLVTGTAGSTPVGLGVGLDGQVLVACSGASTGLCWTNVLLPVNATPTVFGLVKGCTDASNAALGCNALLANTSGAGNIAVGPNSMCANTTGINNVAIGNSASCSNTVGSGNVAIGTSALRSAVDSSRVVAIGEGALLAQTTGGQYNVAVGWSALCNATGTAGGSNVALGALAGNNITTGSSNVIIGPNVTVPYGNQDNQLAIGYNLGQCWLTGDSAKNVKFWAGIRDYTDSLGAAGQVLTSNGTVAQWATPASSPIQRASVSSFIFPNTATTVITFAPDLNNGRAVQFWVTGQRVTDFRAQLRTGTWIRDFNNNVYDIPWSNGTGGLLGLEDPGSGTPGIRIRNTSGANMNVNVAWLPIWS